MLCADALAFSRSSTHVFTAAFSRASHYFLPEQCGEGRYQRGFHSHGKVAAVNSTAILLAKPEAKVGIHT